MHNEQNMVRQFHAKFNCPTQDTPVIPSTETRLLRTRLLIEEVAEYAKASACSDVVGMVDALCDIVYIALGSAIVMGVDLAPAFAEVHSSNMTKSGGGHDVSGKVIKGPDFRQPDIIGILQKQGWNNEQINVG